MTILYYFSILIFSCLSLEDHPVVRYYCGGRMKERCWWYQLIFIRKIFLILVVLFRGSRLLGDPVVL